MNKLPYPESVPLQFVGFPASIDIRLGSIGASFVPSASLGTKVSLTQTPKSLVAQGEYVMGNDLPDYKCIYSDTGEDENYNIKITFDGFASFFFFYQGWDWTSNTYIIDKFYTFYIRKLIIIEFKGQPPIENFDEWECETLIPSGVDLSSLTAGPLASLEFSDFIIDSSEYIFVSGVKYYIDDGETITIKSKTGVDAKFTRFGDTITLSS